MYFYGSIYFFNFFSNACLLKKLVKFNRVLSTTGVANTSIAIDWLITKSQLVNRALFCVELTRYIKIFSINIPFYDICTCDLITDQSITSYQEIF